MANQWWEIKIEASPELEEMVFWRLQELGCKGASTEKLGNLLVISGYLPSMSMDIAELSALSSRLEQDSIVNDQPVPMVKWQLIDEEDWASSWKENWQPLEIGDRFLIYPAWLDIPKQSSRLVLRLNPGSAFGTGGHPTTQLCLEALEMRLSDAEQDLLEDLVMADIGCGSGILSIGAHLLGVKQIYAVDIDPLAVKATRENSYLNQIKDLNIAQGSIEQLESMTEQKFDGIVCNILAEVIKGMIPKMTEIVKPHGWGILSGILNEQSTEIVNLLEDNDWVIGDIFQRENWCCLNIQRKE